MTRWFLFWQRCDKCHRVYLRARSCAPCQRAITVAAFVKVMELANRHFMDAMDEDLCRLHGKPRGYYLAANEREVN